MTGRRGSGGSMEAFASFLSKLACVVVTGNGNQGVLPQQPNTVHPESGWWEGDPCSPQTPPALLCPGASPRPCRALTAIGLAPQVVQF